MKVEGKRIAHCATTFEDSLIGRFVKFAGVSESSRQTYTKCLKQLFKFFSANEITNPSRADLIDWLNDMKAAGKSASTVQLYLTATKIFFRWLAQEGICQNIADHMKSGVKPSHNHKKDALSTDQCRNLIEHAAPGNAEMTARNRAVLSLMTTAGLRTIEVVRANVGDIRHEHGKIYLAVWGKGHSAADEKVLLAKQTFKAIREYLSMRKDKIDSNSPLFTSTSRSNCGQRLTTQTIRKMCKASLRGIGLDSPRLTAHSLRHSTATNLIFAGVELPKVQKILRHKNLNTTMIYAAAWERYQNDGEQILADEILNNSKSPRRFNQRRGRR